MNWFYCMLLLLLPLSYIGQQVAPKRIRKQNPLMGILTLRRVHDNLAISGSATSTLLAQWNCMWVLDVRWKAVCAERRRRRRRRHDLEQPPSRSLRRRRPPPRARVQAGAQAPPLVRTPTPLHSIPATSSARALVVFHSIFTYSGSFTAGCCPTSPSPSPSSPC